MLVRAFRALRPRAAWRCRLRALAWQRCSITFQHAQQRFQHAWQCGRIASAQLVLPTYTYELYIIACELGGGLRNPSGPARRAPETLRNPSGPPDPCFLNGEVRLHRAIDTQSCVLLLGQLSRDVCAITFYLQGDPGLLLEITREITHPVA